MKTIEQEASIFAHKKINSIPDSHIETLPKSFVMAASIDGFKAGFEFAQRWIPVEEESPAEYEWVIAKSNHGDHYIVNYSFNTYHVNMPFEVKITHWRPIEYK